MHHLIYELPLAVIPLLAVGIAWVIEPYYPRAWGAIKRGVWKAIDAVLYPEQEPVHTQTLTMRFRVRDEATPELRRADKRLREVAAREWPAVVGRGRGEPMK